MSAPDTRPDRNDSREYYERGQQCARGSLMQNAAVEPVRKL
jgi:hypothetical protein